MPDRLSLTDRLALQRTRLAGERIYLTYVRTSLPMGGFGMVLIQLHPVRTGCLDEVVQLGLLVAAGR